MGIGPWILQDDGETIINGKTGETKKLGDTIDNDVVLAAIGEEGGTYTDTWTVIGVENGKLKLVTTTNVVGNVYLGKNDKKAPSTEIDNLDKAIWSYVNVEDTLNEYVHEATGVTSARSITIEDIETILNISDELKKEKDSSYGYVYEYSYDSETEKVKEIIYDGEDVYFEDLTGYSEGIFINDELKKVQVNAGSRRGG